MTSAYHAGSLPERDILRINPHLRRDWNLYGSVKRAVHHRRILPAAGDMKRRCASGINRRLAPVGSIGLFVFLWVVQPAGGQVLTVDSSYIQVGADTSSMVSTLGTSVAYSPSSSNLTFGFPGSAWSSHVVLNVDGVAYDFSSLAVGSPMVAVGTGLGAYLEGSLVSGDIEVWVRYEIVNNPSTGLNADTLMYQFRIVNNGTVSHDVGLRLEIDTQVILQDGANISVDNGFSVVTNNKIWRAATETIPTDWWDYDISPLVGTPNLVGRGHIWNNPYGLPATAPDVLEIAQWGSVGTVGQWTPAGAGTVASDSALVLWWTGTGTETGLGNSLAPGETMEIITYYGLNQGTLLATPTVSPTVTVPATPTISATTTHSTTITPTATVSPTSTWSPTPTPPAPRLELNLQSSAEVVFTEKSFVLKVRALNTGSAPAGPVTLVLTIPSDLEVVDGAGGTVAGGQITWVVPQINVGGTIEKIVEVVALSGSEGYQLTIALEANYENMILGTSMPSETAQTTVVVTQASYFRVDRNAFNGTSERVRIEIVSTQKSLTTISIYNSAGELIKRLKKGEVPGGLPQIFFWDGTNQKEEPCASGIYLIRVEMKDNSATRRVAIIR